jgi:phage terminase small subunit
MTKLTAKQERFCLEYIKDLNATQAAVRAGYSEKSANNIGPTNLVKPSISARISELKTEIAESIKIDAAWLLRASVDLYSKCMEGERVKDRDGGDMGFAKFHPAGAGKALELIGKHVDVQAFERDKDEEELGEGLNITFNVSEAVKDVRVTRGS